MHPVELNLLFDGSHTKFLLAQNFPVYPVAYSFDDRPSISARNELAVTDRSQNDPVISCLVALQNIIQPTPDRSAARFLS